MTKDFVGTILFTIIALVAFLFTPLYYTGTVELARSQQQLLNEVQLFLDKAADTRTITKDDLDDFSLALATYLPVEYTITREARQINPDPASTTIPKATYTSYIPVDDNTTYDSGDIITIRVKQTSLTLYQTVATKVFRMYIGDIDFKLSRMVR